MLRKQQISLDFVKIVSAKIVVTTKKLQITTHCARPVPKERKKKRNTRKRDPLNLCVNLIVDNKEPAPMLCTVAIT